jgi:Zn-dependent peptidase ImmA (M78 family)
MLYRSSEGAVIGVNSLHPEVRQRFTIAHELAHLLLHQPAFQIDEHAFVAFRGLDSSKATDPSEVEANQFAAALLMPERLLSKCILALGEHPDAERAISELSKRFEVSQEAMTIRLTRLGWLTQL